MATTTTLYKRTHSGLRIWEAQLDPNNNLVVRIRHGAYQGAQQEEVLTHACPEEAQLELNRRIHIKTTKQGYTPHIPDAVPLLPMLVQPYTPHRLPDEVYIQPKMDGFRCIGSNKGLKTRRNEPITSLPHITKALQALPDSVHLDGELWCPGKSFQELASIIKRDSPHPEALSAQYHVFDIQDDTLPYTDRLAQVQALNVPHVYPVTTTKTTHPLPREIQEQFHHYEGIILRDPAAYYEFNNRSYGVQKLKWTYTDECQIVDVSAPITGRSEGAIIFHCIHPETHKVFKVVPKTTIYLRKAMYQMSDSFIGWWARITHEGMSKDGKPLKPRAEAWTRLRTDLN